MGSTTATTTTTKSNLPLRGVQETLMVPLTARHEDYRAKNSLLRDQWAGPILDSIDYDVNRTKSVSLLSTSMILRARLFDVWTTDFIEKNPQATVLHLACGLDSRHLRVNWGSGVRWIDVDMPGVIELRKKFYADANKSLGDYRMIASSVTDDKWLEEIPRDRPTIAVMEGLVMYLSMRDTMRLVERIASRFPKGEVAFDASGAVLVYYLQQWLVPVRNTGAVVTCALDDARIMEECGVKLESELTMADLPGVESYPVAVRAILWAYSWIPYLRTTASYLRYSFQACDC